MTEDGRSQTSDYSASQRYPKLAGRRQRRLRFWCHGAFHELVAVLVDRELSNRVGNLSNRDSVGVFEGR